ncbi:MAG: Hsp20/alpha crystallin family protein [Candidatus Bathyarchaeia archaeon]|jgi:HSP20 family molecular chaperone IbpA
MAKEEGQKVAEKQDLEQLKKEIAQKGKEIEQLKQSVEEMRQQIKGKEKTGETEDIGGMFNDVSRLLDSGFGIFGVSNKVQDEKSEGLVGLINDLAKLTEKSQSYQKRINVGKGGVIDVHVSSRPIMGSHAAAPVSALHITRPNKEAPKTSAPKPSTVGSIKEREPIVDVFEEEDYLRVMAELPGVEENEISLNVEDNTLTISTDTSAQTYFKEVKLPTPVKKKAIEYSYRNGILEVKLMKMKKDS